MALSSLLLRVLDVSHVRLEGDYFPIPLTGDAVAPIPLQYNLNFIPFYFGPYSGFGQSALTSFLNVLLTIPFGFGVSFVARVRARDFLWLTWLPGLFFETSQLLMHLGFGGGFRLIDINDLIFNATGVLLGYGLFRLFAWIYLAATQRFGTKLEGLFGYIYEVAGQA